MSLVTTAFSETAQSLQSYHRQEEARRREAESFGLQSDLREELGDVWEECRHANWDGYDALAVTQESLRHTYHLLEALPMGSPLPSISAEPCGELTLEWYVSLRRLLSVSVSADGKLHFAALLGPNRIYGTEVFYGQWPRTLVELIQEVYCR